MDAEKQEECLAPPVDVLGVISQQPGPEEVVQIRVSCTVAKTGKFSEMRQINSCLLLTFSDK
jgi:hypothetical protein